MTRDKALREQLVYLLKGGGAHADFDAAIADVPVELRGKTPRGAEHSLWEILEHIRIAQRDILEFSRNPGHKSPEWPRGYWPVTKAPPNRAAWSRSVKACQSDLRAMCELVGDPAADLYKKLPHGDGQTLLREALLLADHNSYHVGALVTVRRLLGVWKK